MKHGEVSWVKLDGLGITLLPLHGSAATALLQETAAISGLNPS
jgi:hypothetical protein